MIDHAAVYRSLLPEEKKILRGVEEGMKTHQWVPVEDVEAFTRLGRKTVEYRLNELVDKDIIERYIQSYVGYRLKFDGYDLLAIEAFVRKDTIAALGEVIGVGKESVVLAAMGLRPYAIKFHREGRTSFKQVKRSRQHLVDIEIENFSWLYAAMLAAKREYDALERLYPAVNVPEPVDHNRHAVVMSVVGGVEMAKANLVEPGWYLDETLKQVKKAYELGLIHSDLSEYNVMVRDDGITIIDWPQYVEAGGKTADEMLARDVGNILSYFERKYRIKRELGQTIEWIKTS
ncbi:MAG: RIO-type serine/threonine-protein kinase Rio2 [Methanocella sp. PtaU1.Bin125]|nr:MAG: RIO-type serine/threonine-protein kinase Rio2 [Methanocella sp. PtaU1.Bin125]